MKTKGRLGRETHHFEMFIHRENERARKIKAKYTICSWAVIGCWLLFTLMCYLMR